MSCDYQSGYSDTPPSKGVSGATGVSIVLEGQWRRWRGRPDIRAYEGPWEVGEGAKWLPVRRVPVLGGKRSVLGGVVQVG